MEPWIYPVVLFPVFFVGLWSGVTFLMSRLSGWSSLADSYRAGATRAGLAITGSALLNHFGFPVSYSGVLYVGVGAEGVELSLWRIFALGSPPLTIPWGHLAECRSYQQLGMFDRFVFRPALGDVKITLTGRAARLLRDEAARRGLGAAAA